MATGEHGGGGEPSVMERESTWRFSAALLLSEGAQSFKARTHTATSCEDIDPLPGRAPPRRMEPLCSCE